MLPGSNDPLASFRNIKRWFQSIDERPAVDEARKVGSDHMFKKEVDEETRRALFPSNCVGLVARGIDDDCQNWEKMMTKFALYVPLEAKPGKEKEVADFLRSAIPLVNAEVGTISWFAIQEGPSSFAIFDTFDDEAGRDAHLNGKVAAALMEKAKAGDLFAKTPEIHKLGILADKVPK